MPSILLVDDEEPMLSGVSAVIERKLPGLRIAGKASNGRQAIDLALELKPDIMLIDVRMPGISGIDVLKELRRMKLDSLAILLTAYERFDVAQAAFELGVYEYLVKPLNQDRLVEVLKQASESLEARSEDRRESLSFRERFEGLVPLLEEGFFYDLLQGRGHRVQLYAKELGLKSQSGLIAALSLPSGISADEMQELSSLMRSTLSFRHRCMVGAPSLGALPLFISLEAEDDPKRVIHGLRRLMVEVSERGIGMAIYSLPINPQTIAESWAGIAFAAAGLLPGELKELDRLRPEMGISPEKESGRGLYERALSHEDRELETDLRDIFHNNLSALGARASLLWAQGALALSLALAESALPQAGDPALAFLSAPEAAENPDKAFEYALEECLRRRQETFTQRSSGGAAEAVKLIKTQFSQPLSLEDLADSLGLRPSLLSRMVQDETGKPFMEFLISLRIEHAKSELKAGGKTIKEIAAACGYSDPNYFSRLFKKETGLTPSEFIQRGESA